MWASDGVLVSGLISPCSWFAFMSSLSSGTLFLCGEGGCLQLTPAGFLEFVAPEGRRCAVLFLRTGGHPRTDQPGPAVCPASGDGARTSQGVSGTVRVERESSSGQTLRQNSVRRSDRSFRTEGQNIPMNTKVYLVISVLFCELCIFLRGFRFFTLEVCVFSFV